MEKNKNGQQKCGRPQKYFILTTPAFVCIAVWCVHIDFYGRSIRGHRIFSFSCSRTTSLLSIKRHGLEIPRRQTIRQYGKYEIFFPTGRYDDFTTIGPTIIKWLFFFQSYRKKVDRVLNIFVFFFCLYFRRSGFWFCLCFFNGNYRRKTIIFGKLVY